MTDIISDGLTAIMNAKIAGKSSCTIKKISKLLLAVLDKMKAEGYINYKIKSDRFEQAVVQLGKLNECRAIRPRFNVQVKEIDRFVRRFLPSRELGVLLLSTSKGVLTHKEALEQSIGGTLIAYSF